MKCVSVYHGWMYDDGVPVLRTQTLLISLYTALSGSCWKIVLVLFLSFFACQYIVGNCFTVCIYNPMHFLYITFSFNRLLFRLFCSMHLSLSFPPTVIFPIDNLIIQSIVSINMSAIAYVPMFLQTLVSFLYFPP